MRELFETKSVFEVIYYSQNQQKGDVRVTMTNNGCFKIDQFNLESNRYFQAFETSSNCNWEVVEKHINFLLSK